MNGKALGVSGGWVTGEVKELGNVFAVVNWETKQCEQVYGNTICYEVGHKLSAKDKPLIYENDIYLITKSTKGVVIGVENDKIVFRVMGSKCKPRHFTLAEFKQLKPLNRNTVGNAHVKWERYDDDTIKRLFDYEMAKIVHEAFLHTPTNDSTIEGVCAGGYNLLPMGNLKYGKLVYFSHYGCLSMSRRVLLQFVGELCDIANTYFNPRRNFDFSLFEPPHVESNFTKLS